MMPRNHVPGGRKQHGKIFSLGVVLSITTDRLLCPIGHVYKLLNYLTGASLCTHQLPRAGRTAAPYILQQHPDLADIDVSTVTTENWRQWLRAHERQLGGTRRLTPLPPGVYQPKDPIAELLDMGVAPERIIGVKS